MNKLKLLVLSILIFSAALVFAQEEAVPAQEEQPAVEIQPPQSIIDNQYYLQSVRLNERAKEAYEIGDYDAAAAYAEQAAEYARLSDEYVAMRLADYAIARAHSRYTWAGSVGAATRFPSEYQTATAAYNEAIDARKSEDWDGATEAAHRVLAALLKVTGSGGQAGPGGEPPRPPQGALPAQYIIRQWRTTGDCFWNIAGWSWVYGDPYQWRKLYDANKDKLPDPSNPNWMEPDMILDIPSIGGEVRSGMWDPSGKY